MMLRYSYATFLSYCCLLYATLPLVAITAPAMGVADCVSPGRTWRSTYEKVSAQWSGLTQVI